MADALTFVIGIGIASMLLFLVMRSLKDNEHDLLKFFLMMSILSLMLLLPKVFGDAQNVCVPVIANETVTGNLTEYAHTTFCYTDSTSTTNTFMTIIFWVYRGLIAYVIVWLFMVSLRALWEMRKVRPR